MIFSMRQKSDLIFHIIFLSKKVLINFCKSQFLTLFIHFFFSELKFLQKNLSDKIFIIFLLESNIIFRFERKITIV